jgi:predicted ATPase
MVLARMSSSEKKLWGPLREKLAEYGEASGLFQRIEVRRKGRKLTDPFQVLLRVAGPSMNLVDVGYGVSQVLPILVDSLMADKGQTLLVQQPEVHLHPKAQAELGSFLGYLAKKEKKQFVIETHSDYLIDRVRMDVRDGKGGLKPKDVQILYFERNGAEVEIHPIGIDAAGNILGAPKGYRKFFLDEVKKSIGVSPCV